MKTDNTKKSVIKLETIPNSSVDKYLANIGNARKGNNLLQISKER